MPRAPKSKQSNAKATPPLATRSQATAPVPTIDKTTGNPHRKNTKLWKEWEAVNNPLPPVEPATVNPTSSDLQNLTTRLQALDDYTTDKWDNLDSLLDSKIELLATALANRFEPLITGFPTALGSATL